MSKKKNLNIRQMESFVVDFLSSLNAEEFNVQSILNYLFVFLFYFVVF